MKLLAKLIKLKNLVIGNKVSEEKVVVSSIDKLTDTRSSTSDAGFRYRNVFDSDKIM